MKVFVEYYHKHVTEDRLVAACGDRAIVQLDGRNTLATWHSDARAFNGNRRPRYDGYRILRGETLLSAKPITGVEVL